MNRTGSTGMENPSRRQALVAALAPFLVGLGGTGITVMLLLIGGPSQVVQIGGPAFPHTFALIAIVVTLALLAAAALTAAVGRLPFWAWPWVAVDMIGLVVALNLTIEGRAVVFSPAVDVGVLALFFLASLTVLGAAAARGWQQIGLLSVGVATTMGLSLCFWIAAGPFRSDLGLLAGLLGLAFAALTYAYARRSKRARVAVLLTIALANGVLAWFVDRAFLAWDLFPDQTSLLLPLIVFSTGPLLGGPLLGLLVQGLRLVARREPRPNGVP